ncbi:cytochrome c maturation protein CcmE [Blastococcus sp. MG754426]|nr:cytochrome c maturation protein CcmE [Blastococcus sp. MG754426]MCF6510559.1 cytochrome c maturation protein CcmE [Blastococcus sp. MG754427]
MARLPVGHPPGAGRPVTRPAQRRRTLSLRLLVVVGAVGGALALLGVSGLADTLVYYRTPTELLAEPPPEDERLRLGGLVQVGSVERVGSEARFAVTDGVATLPVVYSGALPAVFAEGQGAVVEGRLGADGVFVGDLVLVKHSNEYRPVGEAG